MAKIKPNESGPQGDLEDVHLTLTMALLYGLSASAINKVCPNFCKTLTVLLTENGPGRAFFTVFLLIDDQIVGA